MNVDIALLTGLWKDTAGSLYELTLDSSDDRLLDVKTTRPGGHQRFTKRMISRSWDGDILWRRRYVLDPLSLHQESQSPVSFRWLCKKNYGFEWTSSGRKRNVFEWIRMDANVFECIWKSHRANSIIRNTFATLLAPSPPPLLPTAPRRQPHGRGVKYWIPRKYRNRDRKDFEFYRKVPRRKPHGQHAKTAWGHHNKKKMDLEIKMGANTKYASDLTTLKLRWEPILNTLGILKLRRKPTSSNACAGIEDVSQ